jgi:hypothetical protein
MARARKSPPAPTAHSSVQAPAAANLNVAPRRKHPLLLLLAIVLLICWLAFLAVLAAGG